MFLYKSMQSDNNFSIPKIMICSLLAHSYC